MDDFLMNIAQPAVRRFFLQGECGSHQNDEDVYEAAHLLCFVAYAVLAERMATGDGVESCAVCSLMLRWMLDKECAYHRRHKLSRRFPIQIGSRGTREFAQYERVRPGSDYKHAQVTALANHFVRSGCLSVVMKMLMHDDSMSFAECRDALELLAFVFGLLNRSTRTFINEACVEIMGKLCSKMYDSKPCDETVECCFSCIDHVHTITSAGGGHFTTRDVNYAKEQLLRWRAGEKEKKPAVETPSEKADRVYAELMAECERTPLKLDKATRARQQKEAERREAALRREVAAKEAKLAAEREAEAKAAAEKEAAERAREEQRRRAEIRNQQIEEELRARAAYLHAQKMRAAAAHAQEVMLTQPIAVRNYTAPHLLHRWAPPLPPQTAPAYARYGGAPQPVVLPIDLMGSRLVKWLGVQ